MITKTNSYFPIINHRTYGNDQMMGEILLFGYTVEYSFYLNPEKWPIKKKKLLNK